MFILNPFPFGAAPPAPTLTVFDTFTGTAGTGINSRPPEIGANWQRHPGWSSGSIVISSAGRARANTSSAKPSLYFNGALLASDDHYAEAEFHRPGSEDDGLGLCVRVHPTALTFYYFRYSVVASAWQLYRFVNGSPSLRGDFPDDDIPLDGHRLARLEAVGDQIMGYVDGVVRVSVTDTAIPSGAHAGIRFYVGSNQQSGDARGGAVDNFKAHII